MNKTSSKEKIATGFINTPTQKTFMKYYEENIELKNRMAEKDALIKQLRTKLQYQSNLNRTSKPSYQDVQSNYRTNQKSKSPNKKNQKQNRTMYNAPTQSKKVQNLLQIIDHYKQKLMLAEEEVSNMRRQKALLEQDVQLKDRRVNQFASSSSNIRTKTDQGLTQKFRQKSDELQRQKERNKWTEAELRRLQAKVRTLQLNKDQLDELKIQNRRLQEHVLKVTTLRSNQNITDQIATQQKCKELQEKLKLINQKYNKLKEDNMKSSADYKLLENKLIQLSYQNQQYQKETLRLKKLEIDNPIMEKLAKNPQLLMKVVGEIQKPTTKPMSLPITPQQLLLEKGELAKQLLETQSKLKTLEQNWKQKQVINKIQKEQLLSRVSSLPQGQAKKNYTSKMGVQYDGDISVFSDQKISYVEGVNYFDIFLGKLSLLQTMVQSVTNIKNTSNPLILATLDFYNHNTVNTKLTQGCDCDLHSEITFKISQDSFFFNYLNKGSFKIDIWASEGNKNHHIGRVEIPLKSLFLKSKANIAPVINTSAAVYLNQKIMGTINLDMRMRFPIHQQAERILNLKNSEVKQQNAPKRKLIVQIEQGSGFNQKSSLFVYYPFRLQDFYTKTAKGPTPKWNHYKMLDITYNTDVKNYLRKNQLQLTVFDDNATLYDQKDSDVLGTSSISLLPLLEDRPIKQKIQIRKNGKRVGIIDIKVFWYEAKQKVDNQQIVKQTNTDDLIHEDILKYIKQNKSSSELEFKRIDDNNSGMVSFDEFNIWFSKMKHTQKYTLDAISKYYNTFKQPLNMINFVSRLKQTTEEQRHSEDLIAEFGMINKFLRTNSVQIKNKISIEEYLKDKDLLEITLEIDKNKDGKISKGELVEYLEKNNVESKEVKDQVIHLTDFLQKYQPKMRNSRAIK